MGPAELYGEERLDDLRDQLLAVAASLEAEAHKFNM
jgi:hypothetical protein